MVILFIKHWKRNLLIPVIFYILLFVLPSLLGTAGLKIVEIAHTYFWLYYILLGIAILMFIAGLMGASIAASRRFTLIRFATGVIVVLVVVGIWLFFQYQKDKEMRYCEVDYDCNFAENYGCINSKFFEEHSAVGVALRLCGCQKNRCTRAAIE